MNFMAPETANPQARQEKRDSTEKTSKECPTPGRVDARLKAEAICLIIRACAEAKVTEFEYGNLSLRFGTPSEPRSPKHTPVPPEAPQSPDNALSERAKEIEVKTLARDEQLTKEQIVAELPITDPLEYERALANGDLEDVEPVDDAE